MIPVKLTRRQILSKLAGIFDPIGAGAAVLIKPKIAMQQLLQIGLGWDEEVPPNERMKWLALFEEMTALNDVKFDRCLTPPGADGNPSLVVFFDASRLAFGACAYARWKLVDGNFGTRFVAAKARVPPPPLKELTIPRLELQAALESPFYKNRGSTSKECATYQTAASPCPGSREKHAASNPLFLVEQLRSSLTPRPKIGPTVPLCSTLPTT